MMEQRTWHHDETPLAKASAAAYRTGCKCEDCYSLYWEYIHDYRTATNALRENGDGTTAYHVHRGQPSATTARKWGCIHPRCLNLAGLYLDQEGDVRDRITDALDPAFGVPSVDAPARPRRRAGGGTGGDAESEAPASVGIGTEVA